MKNFEYFAFGRNFSFLVEFGCLGGCDTGIWGLRIQGEIFWGLVAR